MSAPPCLAARSSVRRVLQTYLDGAADARTPEILMRSRYTAFARGDVAYLRRPGITDTVPDLRDDGPSNWIDLKILGTGVDESGGNGQVEFVAKLLVGDRLAVLHEVSAFERIDGRWSTARASSKADGAPPQQISMKDPLPLRQRREVQALPLQARFPPEFFFQSEYYGARLPFGVGRMSN